MHQYYRSSYILFISFFLLFPLLTEGKDKKKSTFKGKQYEDANFIQKAWGDLTTRNNWYFNANEKYKELIYQNQLNKKLDFSKPLPFYFYSDGSMKNYTSELQQIEKKMGIVLQIRNYSRWKDNCYLLLGKSQFLQDKIDTSLITFQYIVTTMKPDNMNAKVSLTNKERMKYLRQREKEIQKKNAAKKKVIEIKWKEQQKANEQKIEDLRDKQEQAIEDKKKRLEELIKAKKKIIALQKKGKKIPPELLAKVKTQKDTATTSKTTPVKPTTPKQPQQTIDKNKPYILIDDEWVKNPFYVDSTNRKNENPLENELTKKEEEQWDKLSFWEKIKHKHSRAEALTWFAQTLIKEQRYADAQGIIAYAKSLRKLTKKQRKDIYLVDAYYHLERNNIPLVIERLENTMMLFKDKDERAYYEFILAQLYQKNNQPADASDYYEKGIKDTKDEKLAFYSKLKMTDIFAQYPELTDKNVEKLLAKLVRFGKNKDVADEVYYEMALFALNNSNDTITAIKQLQKSIQVNTGNNTQKGLSYLLLGKIFFEQENYFTAKPNYDSTIIFLPKENEAYPQAQLRQEALATLVANYTIIEQQDSLQHLGKMSEQELKAYIASLVAQQEKTEKKKSKLSIEENTSSVDANNASTTIDVTTSNGLWYFYNPELKSKGYTTFKSIWGDRPLELNWRRSNKSLFDDEEAEDNPYAKNKINTSVTTPTAIKTDKVELKLPKTPEDFVASDKKIVDAYFAIGETFQNKLKNAVKAKETFDELIRRFPNSKYDAIAHYYEYLIYTEQNFKGLADKEKQYILENYPLSEVAQKLQQSEASDEILENNSPSFYTTTYQAFLNNDCSTVFQNRQKAKSNYSGNSMAQFEFLEALCYGKQKDIKKYKQTLSDIVLKYPNTETGTKAQEYLINIIQYENNLKDSTQNINFDTIKVSTPTPDQIEFEYDTFDLIIVVQLQDAYFKLQDVVKDLELYCAKKVDGKIKANPVFFKNNQEIVITLKKFEEINSAITLMSNLNMDRITLFKDKAEKVSIYLISSDNFKLIKSFADLQQYQTFFIKKYISNE